MHTFLTTLVVLVALALGVWAIFATHNVSENSVLSYAKQYSLKPLSAVDTHFTAFGTPFNYAHKGMPIYSLPTNKGTLFVRFELFGKDSLILVHGEVETTLQ